MALVTAGISENTLQVAGQACSQVSIPQNCRPGFPIFGPTAQLVALLCLLNPFRFKLLNRVHRPWTTGTFRSLRLEKRPRPHLIRQTISRLTLPLRNSATKMGRPSQIRDAQRQLLALQPRQYRISSAVSVRRLDIREMARTAPS
jgi:hypothetical protein